MVWANLKDMAYDDDELYDRSKGMPDDYEPPDYPPNLCFMISGDMLAKAGLDGGEPGDSAHFAAMAEVTSIHKDEDDCRIELEVNQFAGEDGKFFDLEPPSHICLCGPELEKMGLEADCERGDTIHLVGTAKLKSISDSEFMGNMATLQITELTFSEDESSESREG